jgi:hypothetical protein
MKKQIAIALVLALAPFAASARDSLGSYTYVEGGYTRLGIDNDSFGDVDFDGAFVRTSIEMTDNLHFTGGLAWTQSSDLPVDVDALELQVGLGYRYTFADNVDLTVDAQFQRQEIKPDSGDKDVVNNTRVNVGVRGALSNSFEGWVKLGYVDGGLYDGDGIGTLGGQVVLSETWGIVGEVEAGADTTRAYLGVRASF